jgi:hypothetical protein
VGVELTSMHSLNNPQAVVAVSEPTRTYQHRKHGETVLMSSNQGLDTPPSLPRQLPGRAYADFERSCLERGTRRVDAWPESQVKGDKSLAGPLTTALAHSAA